MLAKAARSWLARTSPAPQRPQLQRLRLFLVLVCLAVDGGNAAIGVAACQTAVTLPEEGREDGRRDGGSAPGAFVVNYLIREFAAFRVRMRVDSSVEAKDVLGALGHGAAQ